MTTLYAITADLVVAVHVAYVAFVVLGLVVTVVGIPLRWSWIRNRWFRGLHLAMILIVVAESWAGITCPLTTWESQLRRLAGKSTSERDFIGRWLHELLFVDLYPETFTLIYTAFGLAVLSTLFLAPPRWRAGVTRPHEP